jgi:hypothetical protein
MPFTRLQSAYEAAVKKVHATIAEDGFFSVDEFKELIASDPILIAEELLEELQQQGVTFIKTSAVNKEYVQEVLIDVRYMAAAMLLIYSDKGYALKHSVLKYLKKLFAISEWKAAFPMIILPGLLDDMYEQLGHFFTDQTLAEAASLTNEDETVIVSRALRYSNPMRELVKSDAELTAVYELAMRVMDVANGTTINGRRANRGDVNFRHFQKPKAYNLFWTAAQKILDRHSKKKTK